MLVWNHRRGKTSSNKKSVTSLYRIWMGRHQASGIAFRCASVKSDACRPVSIRHLQNAGKHARDLIHEIHNCPHQQQPEDQSEARGEE